MKDPTSTEGYVDLDAPWLGRSDGSIWEDVAPPLAMPVAQVSDAAARGHIVKIHNQQVTTSIRDLLIDHVLELEEAPGQGAASVLAAGCWVDGKPIGPNEIQALERLTTNAGWHERVWPQRHGVNR